MNEAMMLAEDSPKGMIARTPIIERLRKSKAIKEQELSDINEAIKVLESNPGFVEALDVLGKVSNRLY